MIKASALYMVVVVALVIAVVCSVLLTAAYLYRGEYQARLRKERLLNNVGSGVNILLASGNPGYTAGKTIDLFSVGTDSVKLKRNFWGTYDVGTVVAFSHKDSAYRTFMIANKPDSAKWCALYLIDEDRPLSLSGKTSIRGDAYLPKAGVKPAYIDNQSYQGDKKMVSGKTHDSDKQLPPLLPERLSKIRGMLNGALPYNASRPDGDLTVSFLQPAQIFHMGKTVGTLQGIHLKGNIIVCSDTTVFIENSAALDGIMIFAKVISVKSGFNGKCQLYARDSIMIAGNCRFSYPSAAGLIRSDSAMINLPGKLSIGEQSIFEGQVFTCQQGTGTLPPILSVGKNVRIFGQIYSQGQLLLSGGVIITGSAYTSRFLYKSQYAIYENYLINATLDGKGLSPYYLSSELLPGAATQKKVLQWLEVK